MCHSTYCAGTKSHDAPSAVPAEGMQDCAILPRILVLCQGCILNAALKHAAGVQERYYSEKLHINTKDPSGSRKVVEDFLQASSAHILPTRSHPSRTYSSRLSGYSLQFLALDKDIPQGMAMAPLCAIKWY